MPRRQSSAWGLPGRLQRRHTEHRVVGEGCPRSCSALLQVRPLSPQLPTTRPTSTSLGLMTDELTAEDLAVLPVDELGLWLLRSLCSGEAATFQRAATIGGLVRQLGKKLPPNKAYRRPSTPDDVPHLAKALAEAWAWLRINGLVAESAEAVIAGMPVPGYEFVTRLGERVAAHERPLEWISATRRLALPLHPRLDERARRQFVMGEFEAAVFVAMKEVEVGVRERAGLPDTMLGTDLMNKAFGDQGPLSDQSRPRAEREGIQSLYRGAISVFKNPTSHRSVGSLIQWRQPRWCCSPTCYFGCWTVREPARRTDRSALDHA